MRFMLCVPYNNNTGNGPQQDVAVMARQGKPIFVRVSSTEIGLDSLKRTQQKQIKSNTLSSYPDGPRRWGPAHGNIHVSSVRDSRRKSPLAPRTGVMSVYECAYDLLLRKRRFTRYFFVVVVVVRTSRLCRANRIGNMENENVSEHTTSSFPRYDPAAAGAGETFVLYTTTAISKRTSGY